MSATLAKRAPAARRIRKPAPATDRKTATESKTSLKIEGREVPVSHLEKVYYPKAHFTKAQVIDYYIRVSPVLLPH